MTLGPLKGYRIVELAGLGPGPFCCMLLGDMGADVVRVDSPSGYPIQEVDPLCRNRRSIVIDLKTEAGLAVLLKLIGKADALVEGYRPGVAERLGFGPESCLEQNPKLVYARITGWGQDGPLAMAAGHDINYIALSGVLHAIGQRGGKPLPPLNLIGDYGAGGTLAAFGIVCALLEAGRSGRGQVIDAAMLDASNAAMATFHSFRAIGLWDEQPGTHFLSGAAHFYGTYETRDRKFISIGPLEPKFYELLLEKLGLDDERFRSAGFSLDAEEMDSSQWEPLSKELEAVFRTRTRDEWCDLLEGTDVCFAPVLTSTEASRHPHNLARGNFLTVGGVLQNAPAPRFSRTQPDMPDPPPAPGRNSREILGEAGYGADEIRSLLEQSIVHDNSRSGGG